MASARSLPPNRRVRPPTAPGGVVDAPPDDFIAPEPETAAPKPRPSREPKKARKASRWPQQVRRAHAAPSAHHRPHRGRGRLHRRRLGHPPPRNDQSSLWCPDHPRGRHPPTQLRAGRGHGRSTGRDQRLLDRPGALQAQDPAGSLDRAGNGQAQASVDHPDRGGGARSRGSRLHRLRAVPVQPRGRALQAHRGGRPLLAGRHHRPDYRRAGPRSRRSHQENQGRPGAVDRLRAARAGQTACPSRKSRSPRTAPRA